MFSKFRRQTSYPILDNTRFLVSVHLSGLFSQIDEFVIHTKLYAIHTYYWLKILSFTYLFVSQLISYLFIRYFLIYLLKESEAV